MQLSEINSKNQIQCSQPSLGTMVSCKKVRKIEEYQQALFLRSQWSAQLEESKLQIEILNAKIAKPGVLQSFYQKQKSAEEECIIKLQANLDQPLSKKPNSKDLILNSISPIDFQKSVVAIKKENCKAFHMEINTISEELDQIEIKKKLSFKELAVAVTNKPEYSSLGDELSNELTTQVLERIIQIREHHAASQQTLLKAAIKNGYVQSYTAIHYDQDKLKTILSAMQSQDKELMKSYGISNYGSAKAIAFVKQADLGGFFTGLESRSIEQKNTYNSHEISDGQTSHSEESMSSCFLSRMNLEIFSQGMGSTYSFPSENTNIKEIFNEFVNKVSSDPRSGVPIDLSYQILTESMIQEILKKN